MNFAPANLSSTSELKFLRTEVQRHGGHQLHIVKLSSLSSKTMVVITVNDSILSSYDDLCQIRVFWHLIPPSSLVFRLIHMASSVQPVKQQGMLPVATNRAINNYQRLTAFKLEMMATSPPKPKPTAKRLMSPCQFDNSGTDPTFR